MADIRRFFGSPKGKGKGKGKREGSDEEGNADPDSRCLRGTKRKIGNGKDHGYGNGKDQQNAPGSSLFGYVEGLDDEAALKEAIERSRVEVEGEVSYDLESPKAELNDVGKGKFAIRSSAQGGIPVFPPAPFSSSATPTSAVPTSPDQTQEFELSDGAFSNDDGTIIDRLEGSLDLVFWKRWIGGMEERRKLMEWMLRELAWHRVKYTRPGGLQICTPRYTTTYGCDDSGAPPGAYHRPPKPIPPVLLQVKEQAEKVTGARYNCCIVNFYADGKDSISYHSDDEAFLGPQCSIASLSLGSSRDFYLRRKAPAGVLIVPSTNPSGSKGTGPAGSRPTEKFVLHDGDLLLMRGRTQAEWEHAVPKRANVGERINITFRKTISPRGTNNFYHYNIGDGPTFRFRGGRMVEAEGGI